MKQNWVRKGIVVCLILILLLLCGCKRDAAPPQTSSESQTPETTPSSSQGDELPTILTIQMGDVRWEITGKEQDANEVAFPAGVGETMTLTFHQEISDSVIVDMKETLGIDQSFFILYPVMQGEKAVCSLQMPNVSGKYSIRITTSMREGDIGKFVKTFLYQVGDGKYTMEESLLDDFYVADVSTWGAYEMSAEITRPDSSFSFRGDWGTLESLYKLQLRPIEEFSQLQPLPIEKPFTIDVTCGKTQDTFAFSKEKIVLNGKDCYPRNLLALEEMLRWEKEEFHYFTWDYIQMRELFDFAPQEIVAIERQVVMGMLGETWRINITDSQEIAAEIKKLADQPVHLLKEGERGVYGAGGYDYIWKITLTDQTQYLYYSSNGKNYLQYPNGEQVSFVVGYENGSNIYTLPKDVEAYYNEMWREMMQLGEEDE